MSLLTSLTSKRVRTTVTGMFGNILEWYDFALYGFLAVVIAELFFPAGNAVVSLLGTYGIFAAGFLMRPVGAWLFGHIGDRWGRQPALVASVAVMGLATFLLGLLPTHAAVGLWAPVLLVTLRLFQGLSVGGEFSTSVTYMVEQAEPKSRGFIGSFANIGSMLGLLLGAGAAALVTSTLPEAALMSWGWRVPFLFGGVLGVVAILLRRHLPTTVMHQAQQRHSAEPPLLEALHNNKRELAQAMLLSIGYAVYFYVVLVYLPTYVNEFYALSLDTALQINTVAIALSIGLIPLFGYISDRFIPRKWLLAGAFVLVLLTTWPLLAALSAGGVWAFAFVQIALVVLVAVPLGVAPATYVELFPESDRLTAYSVTFNTSLGLFGGTTPLVATWLVHSTGNLLMPAYYVMFVAVLALGGVLWMRDRSREPLRT